MSAHQILLREFNPVDPENVPLPGQSWHWSNMNYIHTPSSSLVAKDRTVVGDNQQAFVGCDHL